MKYKKIAVLGAGAGGCAIATELTCRGYEVNLHSRYASDLEPINRRGGIEFVVKVPAKERKEFAKPNMVSTNLKEVVTDVDLIIIAAPAVSHEYYAEELAPFLGENQVVFLNPGHVGSSLLFASTLRRRGFGKSVVLCETSRLPYTCRQPQGPGTVEIYLYLKNLVFAAFPAKFTASLAKELSELFSEIRPAKHVLEVGFNCMNAIFHPFSMIANAGWIENTKGDFHYFTSVSPAVARVIHAIEEERLSIVRSLGLMPTTFSEIFYQAGISPKKVLSSGSIYEACHESVLAKSGPMAPSSLNHRFLEEDVPFGLIPMMEIGRFLEVETPIMEITTRLASIMNQTDYHKIGLTLEKMGLAGIRRKDLDKILLEGFDRVLAKRG